MSLNPRAYCRNQAPLEKHQAKWENMFQCSLLFFGDRFKSLGPGAEPGPASFHTCRLRDRETSVALGPALPPHSAAAASAQDRT